MVAELLAKFQLDNLKLIRLNLVTELQVSLRFMSHFIIYDHLNLRKKLVDDHNVMIFHIIAM